MTGVDSCMCSTLSGTRAVWREREKERERGREREREREIASCGTAASTSYERCPFGFLLGGKLMRGGRTEKTATLVVIHRPPPLTSRLQDMESRKTQPLELGKLESKGQLLLMPTYKRRNQISQGCLGWSNGEW